MPDTPPPGRTPLDADAVRAAYRRWARIYDASFGAIAAPARRRAIAAVNRLPGTRVLEMGVGTGLALPHYDRAKRVTGLDFSPEMLAEARARTQRLGLPNIDALLERDAEATGLPDAAFDIAAAMFVASVVPHPRRLLAEMRRLVRPGGWLILVNHFAAERGPRAWVERAMAPASHALGWHPDFALAALLDAGERRQARIAPMPPLGLFTLIELPN